MRSSFLKMVLAAAALSSGLVAGAAHAGWQDQNGQDLKWTQCKYDTQCEVVEGVCGEPMGINNTYRSQVQTWLGGFQPTDQCSANHPHPALNEMAGYCLDNICQVKPDKTYAVIHHQ